VLARIFTHGYLTFETTERILINYDNAALQYQKPRKLLTQTICDHALMIHYVKTKSTRAYKYM
jgi:hypothetical protein